MMLRIQSVTRQVGEDKFAEFKAGDSPMRRGSRKGAKAAKCRRAITCPASFLASTICLKARLSGCAAGYYFLISVLP